MAPPWETCVGLDRHNFLLRVRYCFAPKGRRNGAQGTTLGIDGNALGIDLPFVLCIQYAAKPSRLCAAAGRYCAFVSFVTFCSRLFQNLNDLRDVLGVFASWREIVFTVFTLFCSFEFQAATSAPLHDLKSPRHSFSHIYQPDDL